MFHCLEVKGKDSLDFLHRLSSVNLWKSIDSSAARALLLTGTGKLLAPFILYRRSQDHFSLFSENSKTLSEELEKFHFTEKLSMELLPDAYFPQKSTLSFPLSSGENSDWFSTIDVPSPVSGFILSPTPVSTESYEEERVKQKIPAWGKEGVLERNALDAGYLPWIHRFKGCYPGQEVVERSLNLGHPAKTLYAFTVQTPITAGEKLFSGSAEVGFVTSSVVSQGRVLGLGIVQYKAKDLPIRTQSQELVSR